MDPSTSRRFAGPKLRAAFCVDSLPETADNMGEDFGVSYDDQDAVAERNEARGTAAQSAGSSAQHKRRTAGDDRHPSASPPGRSRVRCAGCASASARPLPSFSDGGVGPCMRKW
ncbi:hypothetical protein NXT3_CH02830 [Sinorhizobium fredii]|uniref:Uncharacterized protein n=1 Tax=Rhizobium fredii TaxID=380 RepID=A0A2L0H7I0_RHIFR|nr:hypothetical protein NXT3_CH02830 [Sinorhizobium fredii]